ncbi:hypothetical protein [Streptomyces naganishii]|uniref:Uncharacterized protein n=1 Tax=Streptomyces naganishii JCM 4654 TaxID=1306179 RepID=A0A919CSU9_9ACTN|nr:hypothetical protein [Streptomyces naganishii]GHD84221.1 hypothetical protein GCM10010508_03430 [Streptomyces naganishii JCM 4654]
MGIRMLNHRPAVSPTAGGAAPAAPPPPVPAFSAGASTARIPTDLAATLRRAATGLRGRLLPRPADPGEAPPWCLWAEVARGYLALFLARLPRPAPGPVPTVTVFVAATPTAADRPTGPPRHNHQGPPPRRDG